MMDSRSGYFGTLRFAAPELLREDNSRVSTETDIYAFACVCIEVFTINYSYLDTK